MRNFFFKKIDLALILFVAVLLSCPFGAIAQGGYTLDFDGTDDYVDCGYIPFSSTMTYEAWIRTTDSKSRSDILSWGHTTTSNEVAEFRASFGKLEFGINDGGWVSLISNASINDGKWHHVAASKNGSAITLYVDGVLDNTGTVGGVPSVNQTDMGVLYNGGIREADSYFTGDLDEIRVWDDIRTQAEIQANMHKELVGNEANLVAYYDMANGSGTSLTDNSSNSNTGTLTNGPVWKTSGAHAGPGMALNFGGGINQYVSVPDAASLDITGTAITLEAWINADAWETNVYEGYIISKEDAFTGYMLRTGNNGQVEFVYGTGAAWEFLTSATGVLTAGQWEHVAAVLDGTEMRIYVNGEEVTSIAVSTSIAVNAVPVYLGTSNGYGTTRLFDGKIDEIRIWSDARTEAEIRANKDRSLEGNEANLVAYYRFDQQADAGNTTLYDVTGNGNNGTLTNITPASDWVASTPFNTWIGSDDSDWSNADNWSRESVPSTEDVGIFTWNAASLAPSSANISARNIYVETGASLSHSGNLTLSGDFYNLGTFTTTGTVSFSGSSAQTIQGSGTNTFGTLSLNNSAGLTLAADVSLTSSLTLTSGILSLDGQTLTLGNSATVSGGSSSTHVKASLGIFRKGYSGAGNFTFPVGDSTYYSPISLNFSGGTYVSAYADVNLTAAKHPNNISAGHYISRYWTVNNSGMTGFSCFVSATYDDSDITGNESELRSAKWNGLAWTDLGAVTTATNVLSGTVSSFSDFTAAQSYTLPPERLNFSAKPLENAILLDWTTASEQNSDFFSIERSSDKLEQWEELGTQAAAGNSTYQLDYQYEDAQPLAGTAWYRLRQVDLDGSFQYSATLAIHFAGAGIVVYPNPVKDHLTIKVPLGQKLDLELINLQGQQIWQQQLSEGTQQIPLSELPSGLYTLRMRTEQNGETSYQIVKQ